jgi:glycerol-3-phosphate dehydrogenase
MAITLALTATELGATLLNYTEVVALNKENDLISGLELIDQETGVKHHIKAGAVVNATGVFSDQIVKMDQPNAKPLVKGCTWC